MKKNICYFGLFVGVLLIAGCSKKQEEAVPDVVRPVKTMVGAGGGSTAYTFPGTVKAIQQVDLSFRVAGPLVKFPVQEGDEVKKGQLLAMIDQRDFKIALSKAEAELKKAEEDFKRSDTLYKSNAVSKADLDAKKSNFDVSKATYEKTKADFADTAMKAPFSGRIGKTFVENFQEVRAKESILSLIDLSKIEILIDISENIIS